MTAATTLKKNRNPAVRMWRLLRMFWTVSIYPPYGTMLHRLNSQEYNPPAV